MANARFVLQRVCVSIVLIFVASFLVYAGVRSTVDPSEEIKRGSRSAESVKEFRESRNLDAPIISQYSSWLSGAIKGDLGISDKDNEKVVSKLSRGLVNTFELVFWGLLVASLFGIASGAFAAINKNNPMDFTLQAIATIGIALPVFWFAYVLIELFTNTIPNWLNLSGPIFYQNGNAPGLFGQTETGFWTFESIVEYFRHMALPVAVLAIQLAASWSRYQRASMIEALESDYIRTAKAKGMKKSRVYFRHGLRNAQVPMVNVIALDAGLLFGGLVVTEYIFGIQGMGSIFLTALDQGDATTLVGWTIVTAVAVVFFNLVSDLVLPIVDPRVRN